MKFVNFPGVKVVLDVCYERRPVFDEWKYLSAYTNSKNIHDRGLGMHYSHIVLMFKNVINHHVVVKCDIFVQKMSFLKGF